MVWPPLVEETDEKTPTRAFDKHPLELGEFSCFAICSAGHAFDATFSRSIFSRSIFKQREGMGPHSRGMKCPRLAQLFTLRK
jgi:hypothetical protein